MSEPTKLGPFLGMDTKLPTSKLIVPNKPNQPGGAYVRDALNVDLTAAGTFQRRGGVKLVSSSVRASSLWSDGVTGYYADNGVIKSFDGTNFATVGTLSSPSARVSFANTPLGNIWTDGIFLCLISNGVSQNLTVSQPNPAPRVAVLTGGSLKAGIYTVAFARVNAAGQRSPIVGFQNLTVQDDGSIQVTATVCPDQQVVFVSGPGGSVLYAEAVIAAGQTTVNIPIVYSSGTAIDSSFEAALPPGAQVRYYRGRLLTVVNNVIYYSHTYNYGVYNPLSNFIALDDPVTLCEPTQDGVFIATANNTWFLDGHDVATAELKPLAPYGAIPGTAAPEPNTLNLWWFTPRGAVRTTDQNTLEMKQDEHIAFSSASTGAALFREENGLSQVITAVSNAAPTGAASATSYMTATTVN